MEATHESVETSHAHEVVIDGVQRVHPNADTAKAPAGELTATKGRAKAVVHHRRRRTLALVISVYLVAFAVLCTLTVAGFAWWYRGSFYPGVRVAGVNLSGLSRSDGAARIAARAAIYREHSVAIAVPNLSEPKDAVSGEYPDVTVTATAATLGLTLDESQALTTAWSVGHPAVPEKSWQWGVVSDWLAYPYEWFRATARTLVGGTTVAVPYRVDEQVVRSFVDTEIAPKTVVPVPAKIAVTGTTVAVVPPQPGLSIDAEALARDLVSLLRDTENGTSSALRAPASETAASVGVNEVQPVADRLDALGNLKVTFTAGGDTSVDPPVAPQQITPGRADLLAWFTPVQAEDGTVSLAVSREAVSAYLQRTSKGVKLTNATINQSRSLDAILKSLTPYVTPAKDGSLTEATKPVSLALVTTTKPAAANDVPAASGTATLGKFSGKYVEVSLADQRMYLVNGETLEQTFAVSSGKWATPTPKGTFSILSKSPRAYSGTYHLYMPYWQNFLNGQYGIHELPEWPNGYKEGANHIGTPVSHGCIRLGVGAAAQVYSWTEIGTPVYIH